MNADFDSLQPIVRDLAQLLVNEVRAILAASAATGSGSLLPSDVAKELKVSPKKVYSWIDTGRLRAINLNGDAQAPRAGRSTDLIWRRFARVCSLRPEHPEHSAAT